MLDILLKSMRLCSRVQLVMYRSDQRKNGKYRLLVIPYLYCHRVLRGKDYCLNVSYLSGNGSLIAVVFLTNIFQKN